MPLIKALSQNELSIAKKGKIMKWENTLENKYYFAKSELFVNLTTMKEAVLVMLIWVVYEFFMWQLGNVLVGIMLELVFGYLLFCCYKAYKNEKVKVWIGNDEVVINSLYRIKPRLISKESIDGMEISERHRKKVLKFVTKEKTYKVTVYRW